MKTLKDSKTKQWSYLKNKMGTLKQGAKVAVTYSMNLQRGETVLIIYDNKSRKIKQALEAEAEKLTNKIFMFNIDSYGKRPIKHLPKEIEQAAKQADVSFLISEAVSNRKTSELTTLRRPVRNLILKHKGRHAGMPGVTVEMMKQGMCADYNKVERLGKKLKALLQNKDVTIKVTTKIGSDFTAEISKKKNWVLTAGKFQKGKWGNLPSGEVFTSPDNINGKIVIDGSLGSGIGRRFNSHLKNNPITMEVKNNRVIQLYCKNKTLQKAYKELLTKDKNSNRIGEFAFGTNEGVKKLVGAMLQDEKMPGIHIAIGDPYAKETNANYKSEVHCDGVLLKPTVTINNKIVMKNGKYLTTFK